MAGYFGKDQDVRPIIIIPEQAKVNIVQSTGNPFAKALENNTDITETRISKVEKGSIKPFSINNQPWCSFGLLENRIFIDDFCHEKHLTLKAQGFTKKRLTFKLKQSFILNNKNQLKTKDEVKLWFPFSKRMSSVLHFRLTNLDTRIHYDHGLINWGLNHINPYASIGFTRDWSKYNTKFGLSLINKNFLIDHRLKIDNNKDFTLFHRTSIQSHGWRFGFLAALNLTNPSLLKKDLLIGFQKKNIDISVKAQQSFNNPTKDYQNWKQWFNTITLTSVFKRNSNQKYGIQIIINPNQNKVKASALIEYKQTAKRSGKVKLNNNLDLTVVIKNVVTNMLNVSVGSEVSLNKKQKKKQFGLQLDFNI